MTSAAADPGRQPAGPYGCTVTDDDFEPWTPDGAARLRTAAAELAAAITAHAAAVTAVTDDAGESEVFAAGERLLPAVLAYADAQFEYTGYGFPFDVLQDYAEEDEIDDEPAEVDDDAVEAEPPVGISVLQRHDYRVTDQAAVLSAGRAAYLRVWPADDEAAAAADVTHLGRALYQVAHADGWHALDRVPGLRPVGGCVRVVDREETLGPDPDEWPEDPFHDGGELLYEQSDLFVDQPG